MDRTGLLAKIYDSAFAIDQGRKWLDDNAIVEDCRINFRTGFSRALEAFREAQDGATQDLELLMIAEYTFVGQELNFCASSDTDTINSLNQAIEDFDRAFMALNVVQKPSQYKLIEQVFAVRPKSRYNKMPKDAFHVACMGHVTRIKNSLRTPGINLLEKVLLEQRLSNIKTAQSVYLQKQKEALETK